MSRDFWCERAERQRVAASTTVDQHPAQSSRILLRRGDILDTLYLADKTVIRTALRREPLVERVEDVNREPENVLSLIASAIVGLALGEIAYVAVAGRVPENCQ